MLLAAATTSCQSSFYPDFCDVVNSNKLQCFPTNGAKKEYQISTVQALGYRCISPNDWREAKKRIRAASETMDLDSTMFFKELQGE